MVLKVGRVMKNSQGLALCGRVRVTPKKGHFGESAASVTVDTDIGAARTMRFLLMLMTDVEWARLSL